MSAVGGNARADRSRTAGIRTQGICGLLGPIFAALTLLLFAVPVAATINAALADHIGG